MSSLIPPEKRKLSSSGSPITIRPPVRAWTMLSMPSRSAVPGATISSALTSRGSWRVSSSAVSSSPARVRHQARFYRRLAAISGTVAAKSLSDAATDAADSARTRALAPSAAQAPRAASAPRPGVTIGLQAELRGLVEAPLGVGDRAQLAGQPELAEARERRARSSPQRRRRARRCATASATARSAPGSSTRTPPTTLTKTSARAERRRRAWRPSTASTSARRLRSMPVDDPARRHELATARRAPAPRRAAAASPPSPRARRCRARAWPRRRSAREASSTSTRPPSRISKTPDLVGRAEAVLQRAQRAVGALALALELQHAVDEVLEHARAGERALLRHVADEQHRGAAAPWRRA